MQHSDTRNSTDNKQEATVIASENSAADGTGDMGQASDMDIKGIMYTSGVTYSYTIRRTCTAATAVVHVHPVNYKSLQSDALQRSDLTSGSKKWISSSGQDSSDEGDHAEQVSKTSHCMYKRNDLKFVQSWCTE